MPISLFRFLPVVMLAVAVDVHAAPPVFSGIGEVELSVKNPQAELAFYRRLFGGDAIKEKQGGRIALQLGESVLLLSSGSKAQVMHTGYAVKGYLQDEVLDWFKREALAAQAVETSPSVAVSDRDGSKALIKSAETWNAWKQRGESEARVSAEPLFHPEMIDEVFITVTNMEVDALHYARLLGKTGSLQAGSLWFNAGTARLRLGQAPVRQKAGFQYFAVLISNTDMEVAADAVFKAGGIIENVLPNGFTFWDPEGLRVEVHVAPQVVQKPQVAAPLK